MVMELDNIKYVQELLGHQSVVQTEKYTKFPMELLKEVFSEKTKSPAPSIQA